MVVCLQVKGMITDFGEDMHCQFLEILRSLLDSYTLSGAQVLDQFMTSLGYLFVFHLCLDFINCYVLLIFYFSLWYSQQFCPPPLWIVVFVIDSDYTVHVCNFFYDAKPSLRSSSLQYFIRTYVIGLRTKLGLILLIKSKEKTILTYNSKGRLISPKTPNYS